MINYLLILDFPFMARQFEMTPYRQYNRRRTVDGPNHQSAKGKTVRELASTAP